MKLMFWNVRGLGNSRARRALKDIVHSTKPEIIVVVEPNIFFGDLPISFLKSITYSIDVIQNSRDISKPNLWILWRVDIPKPNMLTYNKSAVITDVHVDHTCAKRIEL
ncbi:hypothetical protein AMTRI_Chr01g108860 [Amborella trichopoda]